MPDVPFATLIPQRLNRFSEADGSVTVHVPRFTSPWARRWLLPLLPRPEVRLHLDDLGSYVWHQMDGGTTVQEIAERVADRIQPDGRALADVFFSDIREQPHHASVRTTCDSVLWLSGICDELAAVL